MRPSSSNGFDLRDAVDGIRDLFTPRDNDGVRHDIRAAVLTELATQPMHGYQLIQAITERTHGAWTPAPGEVYPTLQVLVDEGLATAAQEGERKVYTLTDAGRIAANDAAGKNDTAQSGDARRGWDRNKAMALPKAGAKLAQAMSAVGHSGTPEQTERAVAIVDEARKKLYALLAED